MTSPTGSITAEDVRRFVEEELTRRDVKRATANKMYIAVDEIASNILQYSGATEMTVTCEVDSEGVTLVFVDNGTPYDPLAKADPDVTLSLEERNIGGLGIFMVKKSMDKMVYEYVDGKNRLTVRKRY